MVPTHGPGLISHRDVWQSHGPAGHGMPQYGFGVSKSQFLLCIRGDASSLCGSTVTVKVRQCLVMNTDETASRHHVIIPAIMMVASLATS